MKALSRALIERFLDDVLDVVRAAKHHRRTMLTSFRAHYAVVVVAITAVVLTGCHDTTDTLAGRSNASRPDRFKVRPVLAMTAAPCRADQVPDRSNRCYSLGPVTIDARQVVSATTSFQPGGGGYGVDIVLTAEGLRRFNALAKRNFGQPMPQNEVALVVDGRVISAPALQTGHFDAGGVHFGGSLSKDDAHHVVSVIG